MTRINFFWIFSFSVLLDQLLKYIIRNYGGFYICNPNIAFGIKISEILFYVLWIPIVFLLAIYLCKKYFMPAPPTGRHDILYITLIMSGAISNIIDRLYYGCITDFIDLRVWPVFNLADIYITIGAIMIIYQILKIKN